MSLALPRNTTHQAEGQRLGDIARVIHRASGVVIVVFVLVHVMVQAALHAPVLAAYRSYASTVLLTGTSQPWVHAVLYFSLVFHTLHGLRLVASELGARIDYRGSFWGVIGLSALVGLWELSRYAG